MYTKFLNTVLHKGIKAPKLCWRTSWLGSKCNSLSRSIRYTFKPNKTAKNFQKVMFSNPTEKEVQKVCNEFEKETGIKMFMVHPSGAYSFNDFGNVLMNEIKKQRFPKDIKYVIFGHGEGSSLVQSGKNRWRAEGDSNIGIFDFINNKIPKGEKVLVNCCEQTPKEIKHLIPKDKPAIGYPVNTDGSSSYRYPLKIVQSGRNEIIGGWANGIMTLY